MILKKFKPTTSSRRHLILLKLSDINKTPLLKHKIFGLKKLAGRNNSGKITTYHKGAGHKRKFRILDSIEKKNSIGIVCSIEYDPNRSGNIAAIFDFCTKKYFYILAPLNLTMGDIIKTGEKAEINLGHTLLLDKIPVGSFIYNVSTEQFSFKSKLSKAAGAYSYLIEKTNKFCKLKLSSGKITTISTKCYATLGIVSNNFHYLTMLGKAGRARWLNKRPKVRGVAMNPIDHPHGGGEGKTSGGRSSVTPWGKPTKSRKNLK